jgi:hypothetical protein
MTQKVFNFMAVSAFLVTTAQIATAVYLFNNQDKYLNQVRSQIIEEVSEIIPGIIESSMTGGLDVDNSLGNMNGGFPF